MMILGNQFWEIVSILLRKEITSQYKAFAPSDSQEIDYIKNQSFPEYDQESPRTRPIRNVDNMQRKQLSRNVGLGSEGL